MISASTRYAIPRPGGGRDELSAGFHHTRMLKFYDSAVLERVGLRPVFLTFAEA